jgi:hypothetical protein
MLESVPGGEDAVLLSRNKKGSGDRSEAFMLKSIHYRYTDGSLPSSLSLCRMARTLSVVLDNAHRMKAMGRMKSNAVYMLNS